MNLMRCWAAMAVCALVLGAAGCSKSKPGKTGASKTPAAATPTEAGGRAGKEVIVTPGAGLSGKVASVNTAGQFVVITFAAGQVPAVDQKLNVYRGDLKVGEVKMSKEQIGANAVADLVTGEARVGDTVRPE